MSGKILFVDDDANLLEGYRRQLRKTFKIQIALGAQEGLALINSRGPFAVVMADMHMPGMNGIEFLAKVRTIAPDSVGMMLTGHADLQTAMGAVNEGRIFRFLTKPCPPEMLTAALNAGMEQYRLVTAERELLERTLRGCVWVLVEIMSMISPTAFSRAARLRKHVQRITGSMDLSRAWRYEVAAMLSQIGTVTLPQALLEKAVGGEEMTAEEQEMYESHASVGAHLLSSIPRLEAISDMILGQEAGNLEGQKVAGSSAEQEEAILGAQILKTTSDLDVLVQQGMSVQEGLIELQKRGKIYNPAIIEALEPEEDDTPKTEAKIMTIFDITVGMIAARDVVAKNGLLLLPQGQEVTSTVLARLRNFSAGVGLIEPLHMHVPTEEGRQNAA